MGESFQITPLDIKIAPELLLVMESDNHFLDDCFQLPTIPGMEHQGTLEGHFLKWSILDCSKFVALLSV